MRSGRMVGAMLLTLGLLACAVNAGLAAPQAVPEQSSGPEGEAAPPADAPVGGAKARIESITAESLDSGTLVSIKSDHPLSYTSYDPDETTLVLELPDVDVSSLEPVITVGTPELATIEIKVRGSEKSSHAVIEMHCLAAGERRIKPMGQELHVFLERSAFASAGAPAADAASMGAPETLPGVEAGQPGDPHLESEAQTADTSISAAKTLKGVAVSGTEEDPVFRLEGDGHLEYDAFELEDPARLVVDIHGVRNGLDVNTIAVGSPRVDRVRVSQFAEKPEMVSRVVFDLMEPQEFRIESLDSSLEVTFSGPKLQRSADIDPAAAPPAEVAPAGAETDLRAASMDLAGTDVVLFDRAASMQEGEEEAPGSGTVSTLRDTIYESRTIAGGKPEYVGEKISVAFRDADLREVMFFFADVMKMNVVLDPDVTGKVDIRLNQVPWDQAFQVILKNQGLDAVEEDNVIRIAKTSKLRQEAADVRALKQAQRDAVDPVTFSRTLSYAKVVDAVQVLQQIKTDRGKIVADVRTNTLIISDIPEKKQAYDGLLDTLDTQTPQVVIEARIVEAIRSYERDLGINWALAADADPAIGTQTNLQFPHRVNFTADVNTAPDGFPSAGGIGLMLGNVLDSLTLDIALEAFEADGKVRILSSPKISTQNNQPATIEQGTQIPVVTTTATEVDVQYVPASLRMIVTPQITAEDTVIMKVTVENNQPSDTLSVADVPGIVTESVNTQILVRTGTTAVIGGIYKLSESENETGIPGLRKIPFFGWLFKNRVNSKESSELLVFITPQIVKNI